MKKYTSDNPEFSKEIDIVERADLVNNENKTKAEKQLLQNDLVLKERMDKYLGDGNTPEFAEGIEADNVIGAINEVFTLGSEKKKQLVGNLTALGIAASTDETWETLLNKVLKLMDTSGANAVVGDILFGKKAAVKGSLIAGTMPNKGAWTGATTGSGNVAIPAGYHNGSGYVSGQGAYNKGVTDADNRVNANSANYKGGYNAGVSAADGRVNADSVNYKGGYNAGVSATKKGTAGAGDVLSGKTFTNGSSVGASGTMPNKGGTTQDAGAVTQDDNYTYLTVPANGYYNTDSKIRALNSNLQSDYAIAVGRQADAASNAGFTGHQVVSSDKSGNGSVKHGYASFTLKYQWELSDDGSIYIKVSGSGGYGTVFVDFTLTPS